jgi:hypothetical protein
MPDLRAIWKLNYRGGALAFLLFMLAASPNSLAQEPEKLGLHNDSIYRYFPKQSPIKATWMSAALPGLGQYYNGQYWKIPIIYGGFSTFAFFVIQNRYEYTRFKEAYALSVEFEGSQTTGNELVDNYTSAQLLTQREYYQSSLELSYILTGVFYLLQIVDATVDAHLYNFNIDDDLSFQIQPLIIPDQRGMKIAPGIGIRYTISTH